MHRIIIVILALGAVATVALADPAQDAAKAFTEGKALLAEGDFEGALDAYRTATRNDINHAQGYRQHYSMLVQVMRLRQKIDQEQDAARWDKMAGALLSFYRENGLHSEALPLDQEISRRHPGSDSAVALARTQLALGMNSEAVDTLAGIDKDDASAESNALLGLAFARQGRMGDARAYAEQAASHKNGGPDFLFDLARLRSRIGDSEGAVAALTSSFESTPPNLLGSRKAEAETSADFATLASASSFATALETQSKVKKSGCGGNCKGCSKKSGAKTTEQTGAPCAHSAGAKTPCGKSQAAAAESGKTPCGHNNTEK